MSLTVEGLMNKAERSLASARLQLEHDYPSFAVSRAYYAMFYIAEALLLAKGMRFSSHGAVTAAYGENFAKTQQLDPKFHRMLINSFDRRQIADYDLPEMSREAAEQVIREAEEFLVAAKASALLE